MSEPLKELKKNIEYKRYYTGIFSINYLFQGFTSSMFTVIIPIYILTLAEITTSDISLIATIILIPSSIKLIFGMLSDKFGVKNIGRRRPWIIIPVMIAGLMWASLPLIIRVADVVISFMIMGLIINTGVMMGDTSSDGLILDICPKERLGRVQGVVWGFRSIGMIAGGPILGFMVYANILINIETTFVILGILMILTSFTTLLIKEPTVYESVKLWPNFKELFKDREDLKTYGFSLFNSVADGIILLFLSLFILIQMGLLNIEEVTLSLTSITSGEAFFIQAIISIISSIGIIFGALLGGLFSDLISRKLSVYGAMFYTAVSIMLLLIETNYIGLYIFSLLIGVGIGWRHSAFSAVISQMAKYHPKTDSTYFAWCTSLSNLGANLGLLFMGLLFENFQSFAIIFLLTAIAQLVNLIPFSIMKTKKYEISRQKSRSP
jgi:PAT family beta-lactamase induction signal transducer AmpG